MMKPAVERHLARRVGELGEFYEAGGCSSVVRYNGDVNETDIIMRSKTSPPCAAVDAEIITQYRLNKPTDKPAEDAGKSDSMGMGCVT